MTADHLPRILDLEHRQTIVEYPGPRIGSFTVTGPNSGLNYRFSAGDRFRWVRDEDLAKFKLLPGFRVHQEHQYDPGRERIERLIEERVAERLAATQPTQPGKAGKKGGRPPIPLPELLEAWHLRHHVIPPWSFATLSDRYLDESYIDPVKTMRARLARLKRTHPDLLSEEACRHCC